VLDTVRELGIDVGAIALEMERSVVSAFTEAFDQLAEGVARKMTPGRAAVSGRP